MYKQIFSGWRKALVAAGLLVGLMGVQASVEAISLQEIQSDEQMVQVGYANNQVVYVKRDTIGVIPQWHPYYATIGDTYLLDVNNQTIEKAQTTFFYNLGFTGSYFAARVKASYLNLTQETLMQKVMELKAKDSGIKARFKKREMYKFDGTPVEASLPDMKNKQVVPVATAMYKAGDKIYEMVYGVNFDSLMP
ncbi:MAG: hypothetical protein HUJ85_01705 [Veillonella sp.]|nr:hypothetical protein [Veillonella sp.]